MNNRKILGMAFIALAALLLMAGCGGGDDTAAEAENAAKTATEAAPAPEAEQVAGHDCAGGCGMKNWPEDQMTEIEGKWYCAGCAKKAQAATEEAGHGDG